MRNLLLALAVFAAALKLGSQARATTIICHGRPMNCKFSDPNDGCNCPEQSTAHFSCYSPELQYGASVEVKGPHGAPDAPPDAFVDEPARALPAKVDEFTDFHLRVTASTVKDLHVDVLFDGDHARPTLMRLSGVQFPSPLSSESVRCYVH